MENGVKNLKRARLFPKTFSNKGNGDVNQYRGGVDFKGNFLYKGVSSLREKK
jgi:hypothetical protein